MQRNNTAVCSSLQRELVREIETHRIHFCCVHVCTTLLTTLQCPLAATSGTRSSAPRVANTSGLWQWYRNYELFISNTQKRFKNYFRSKKKNICGLEVTCRGPHKLNREPDYLFQAKQTDLKTLQLNFLPQMQIHNHFL